MGKVIGLTGGIASGKSTVSRYLKSKGFIILDSDVYAREVMETGSSSYHKIVEHFGREILLTDGTIDRHALGAIVFRNESERAFLNSVIHPEVKQRMIADLEHYKVDNHVVLDIPLLFENKRETLCDIVITVYVTKDVQLKRLMERNSLTRGESMNRIESQMSLDEKKKRSDIVLDNNGDIDALYRQVDTFIHNLKAHH